MASQDRELRATEVTRSGPTDVLRALLCTILLLGGGAIACVVLLPPPRPAVPSYEYGVWTNTDARITLTVRCPAVRRARPGDRWEVALTLPDETVLVGGFSHPRYLDQLLDLDAPSEGLHTWIDFADAPAMEMLVQFRGGNRITLRGGMLGDTVVRLAPDV